MFELNWMGLVEVALKQGITLQDVLPLFPVKTHKCKKYAAWIQNKENINKKNIHERYF